MLKMLRREHELTQMQLAEQLGVTHQHISDVERGRAFPSLQLLIKWANTIGANFLTLLRKAGLVGEGTISMEQESAALFEESPKFAEWFNMARQLAQRNPAQLGEVIRYTKWLLEQEEHSE